MSEQDVRDWLRGAVAGEPPLALDPDTLVASARRQVRRRRALVSSTVATMAVAVAAIAVPVALGGSGGDQGDITAADRSPATAGPAPTEEPAADLRWPPADVVPPTYTVDELHQRGEQMRTVLADRLAEVVPGVTAVEVQPFGGEAAGEVAPGQTYLSSFAAFTLDGTRFAVGVNVFAPGAHEQGPAELCAVEACTVDGGQRLAVEVDTGQRDAAIRIVSVYHFRQDGSVVSVVGYNYDPTAGVLPTDPRPMPVTVEQLGTLAADPAIGL